MELSQSENINYFAKFMSKPNAKKFVLSVEKFCTEYAEENNTPFLLDSIEKTQVHHQHKLKR